MISQNQLQTTTGLSSSLVRSLQCTKGDLLTPLWARERALEGNCPLANISAENCSGSVSELHHGTCSLQGASAALSGTAGRSRSWSVPGQGLAHSYEVDPDRQAVPRWPACCPRPTNNSLRSPRCRPRAAQKRSAEGSRKAVTAVLIRYEPASLPPPPRRRFLKLSCPSKLSTFSPLAGRWRAAVHAHKNKLRLFWSIAGRRGRASARLARFQEVFFVAPGLPTDVPGSCRQPAPG